MCNVQFNVVQLCVILRVIHAEIRAQAIMFTKAGPSIIHLYENYEIREIKDNLTT